MPVSIKRLKQAGVTSGALKKLFTAKEKTPQVQRLLDLIRDRTQQGRMQNFTSSHTWAAIDWCYDAAFYQTTPALIRRVCDDLEGKEMSPQEALNAVKSWGLRASDIFTCTTCNGKNTYTLNRPTFFKVLIPIVKSYVTIRLAKLFNERNQIPLLRYEPREFTDQNRVKAEAVTDLVSKISDDFGYGETLKQAIFNALMYGLALAFPMETWFVEEQEDDDGNPVVVKEGIRYIIPHPSKVFFDLNYPIASINTDTGVEFAAFWRLMRYSDILDSPIYYNKKIIPVGQNWWDTSISGNYFSQVYPCTMKFPQELYAQSKTDRESQAWFYTTNERDKAVFVTNIFMKLSPKQWGLGDYKHPIWFRFEVATDNTVIWAEPVPYTPPWYIGYDSDQNRSRNASLALECVPFQENIGNCLSQILLTVKQNLANAVFWDSEQVDADAIKTLQNNGELMYRGMNFIKMSSQQNRRAQTDPRTAFVAHKFPVQNTVELTQAIQTQIAMLERLLVISSQEIGQPASHEQSATELREISTATSVRGDFTGTYVDAGIFAWKRQLYEASQQYLDKEFTAQVGSDIPNLEDVLKELGFRILNKPHDPSAGKVTIKGQTKALVMDGFISSRDGPRRVDNPKIAAVMFQAAQAAASNPMLAQAVGPEPFLKIMTEAARLAGAPKDFKLIPSREFMEQMKKMQESQQQGAAPDPKQLMDAVRQMIDQSLAQAFPQMQQATMKQVEENVAKPVLEAMQTQQQALLRQKQDIQMLAGRMEELMQATQQAMPLQQQPPMMPEPFPTDVAPQTLPPV